MEAVPSTTEEPSVFPSLILCFSFLMCLCSSPLDPFGKRLRSPQGTDQAPHGYEGLTVFLLLMRTGRIWRESPQVTGKGRGLMFWLFAIKAH